MHNIARQKRDYHIYVSRAGSHTKHEAMQHKKFQIQNSPKFSNSIDLIEYT
jgi:hypothetical protein